MILNTGGYNTQMLDLQNKMLELESHKQKMLSEDNMRQMIEFYVSCINTSKTPEESKKYSDLLKNFLATYGKDLGVVDGLNNPMANAKAAKKGPKGDPRDKAIIKDLNEELGIELKGGNKKIWAERSKTDDRIKIFDKDGNQKVGEIKNGDILEVKSAKYGTVRIQAGGDGEINGGDDKVLSVGIQSAADSITAGLNQINKYDNPEKAEYGKNNYGAVANGVKNPIPLGQAAKPLTPGLLFNDDEIRNLLAALMQMAINAAEN